MTTCRIIQVAAAAPDERYMTTCRIIQVAAAAPDERYMTTNRSIHAAATAPYERYMTTNRSIHAAAAAPYERYMTTNRSIHAAAAAPYERYMTTNRCIHAAAAHPKHVAFVFQGTTQMCSIVRRSNLTPYVKMGRATTFFLAQWQNKLTISSGVRVRAPKMPKFFSFFFWNSCFLLLFKLLVCRTVCEFCNRTDSISFVVCAAAAAVVAA
ncbi:hypothetical protein C3747_110g4 [Trypanosoma cruzi]|uniref:Uncharacterized protein n=2 Tax=Trypanosoma cruzi TaxID=5693 RepID=Q4CVC4_TRYCC|nr:hypothetical protein, conserved [Trypanosoma cruzi]EAN84226.1 hypothetical protein, conserved [Trypanosoma cruzi]PWV06762.1 hypothetical protein C3747_110g2 [Trypanosoma cruzi]PWV06763.1 hypothetical protein C3747_110g3 [Trypanosoma cruzi]PWV06764.1 hypothetical protein C3747_110g4 [Trypanosoma cruzi]|eukprot:XP_806077.1 hypothetical protein [Trypanosoma cruzi strain CL Brener]